jgi:hypothetical protein
MIEFVLPQVTSLPGINEWFKSEYKDSGHIEYSKLSGAPFMDPTDWQQSYPNYGWEVRGMEEIRNRLLDETAVFAEIKKKRVLREYEEIADRLLPYYELKGSGGILATEYNAEVVTNAWLKMYELCEYLVPMCEEKLKNKEVTYKRGGKEHKSFRVNKDKNISSFHLAEAPGNFLLAINHWLNNRYPNANWTWRANSYREIYSAESEYLTDVYGLMSAYPDNWEYGADGDGDITSPSNIISFAKQKYDFSTGDVKYMPPSMNYDLEEEINTPVIFGQFISSISVLEVGGISILKMFNFHTAPMACMMYIGSYCFDKFMVVKPETSRMANSEIYTVGIGYKGNMLPVYMEAIFKYMNFIRYLNTGIPVPALFTGLPDEYMDVLANVAGELCDSQITGLERNISMLRTALEDGMDEVRDSVRESNSMRSREWINRVHVEPIIDQVKLIKRKRR